MWPTNSKSCLKPTQVPTLKVVTNSNHPPKTVPYSEYKYPNWETDVKGSFHQADDGFGFSNFRRSNGDPNTINESFHPNCRLDRLMQPNNPLLTQEAQRSESLLFREKYGDYETYYDYEEKELAPDYNYEEVISKTINTNPLMKLYFSRENVKHLLYLICRLVKEFCPAYKITPEAQNKTELLTVMRSIYFSVPTNPYGDLNEELCRLNRGVLDWIVPRTLVNIQSYLGYVRDQSTRRETIPRPENVNTAGTRTNILFPIR